MQYGGAMETEQIRQWLSRIANERGMLKKFCKQNDLPYFNLWRFANGKTEKLDHELGQKITRLAEGHEVQKQCIIVSEQKGGPFERLVSQDVADAT